MSDIITNQTASKKKRPPEWQLRAEVELRDLAAGGASIDQVRAVLQELGTEPAQVERIHKALSQAVNRAMRRVAPVTQPVPVLIRLWSSKQFEEGAGCGFFIVEKPAFESQSAALEVTHLIELFLYQERQEFVLD